VSFYGELTGSGEYRHTWVMKMRHQMSSPATVLVVENDSVTRELLENILRAGGFDVLAMPTGNAALLLLCQQPDKIAWLVTRTKLPGLVDGWILADEYHRHHAGRPAILLSDPVSEAECPSIDALFIPPTAPLRVLEALKGMTWAKPAQVFQINIPRAA
jgi:CheY-like chemotaxis protein